MNTDPIADMLTRIRNGIKAGKASINMPHSNMKESILNVMKSSNYISDVKVVTEGKFKNLEVQLAEGQESLLLKRVSKPGQRIYVKSAEIPSVLNGLGTSIISTSQGIMTGYQAKKQKLGGEIICEVY